MDRLEAIERFVREQKVVRLPYMGKPRSLVAWEARKAMRRSTNSNCSKARKGRAAPGLFFKRGEGCI
jgi:hypothetical protein